MAMLLIWQRSMILTNLIGIQCLPLVYISDLQPISFYTWCGRGKYRWITPIVSCYHSSSAVLIYVHLLLPRYYDSGYSAEDLDKIQRTSREPEMDSNVAEAFGMSRLLVRVWRQRSHSPPPTNQDHAFPI